MGHLTGGRPLASRAQALCAALLGAGLLVAAPLNAQNAPLVIAPPLQSTPPKDELLDRLPQPSASAPQKSVPLPSDVVPLDQAGFASRTEGRTITYYSFGQPYGVEEYLPGNRVKWIFEEGKCKTGEWFQAGNQICFAYDGEEDLQCWIFSQTEVGLQAWFEGNMGDEPLVSHSETEAPLQCEIIGVGV